MSAGANNHALRRVFAVVVDFVVMCAAVLGVFGLLGALAGAAGFIPEAEPDPETLMGWALAAVALLIGMWLLYEVGSVVRWGGTLGKRAAGLRVIAEEGYDLEYGRVLGRTLLKGLFWFLWNVAIGFILGFTFYVLGVNLELNDLVSNLVSLALLWVYLRVDPRHDKVAHTRVVLRSHLDIRETAPEEAVGGSSGLGPEFGRLEPGDDSGGDGRPFGEG